MLYSIYLIDNDHIQPNVRGILGVSTECSIMFVKFIERLLDKLAMHIDQMLDKIIDNGLVYVKRF